MTKINKCYNCICNACTRFHCPYAHTRCQSCTLLEMRKIYDCDSFENKHTAPKRYSIRRRQRYQQGNINAKLDAILEALNCMPVMQELSGTWAVVYNGTEIYRGTRTQADEYKAKLQSGFSRPLELVRLKMV